MLLTLFFHLSHKSSLIMTDFQGKVHPEPLEVEDEKKLANCGKVLIIRFRSVNTNKNGGSEGPAILFIKWYFGTRILGSGIDLTRGMIDLITRIEGIIQDPLDVMGYRIVRTQISGKKRWRLQIMIERKDDAPVTVDDCARASREISVLLDVEDPIEGQYMLEVSSPGLDRPLVRKQDYQRFVGSKVKLQTHELFKGQKKFTGRLIEASEGGIVLEFEDRDEALEMTYDEIHHANIEPEF